MAHFRFASFLSFIILALFFLASTTDATDPKQITVKSNESIQEAIKNAPCGSTITVEKGTYNEQIIIDKDDITLIGKPGAIIAPPKPYVTNICTQLAGNETDQNGQQTNVPTHVGICIIGRNVVLNPFLDEHKKINKTGELTRNVQVSGFEINGFNGINIAAYATRDVQIFKNKLVDGGKYGALTVGSINNRIQDNVVTAAPATPGFIGICNDDKSDVKIWNNFVTNYFTGLCIQTNGADIKGNHVTQFCYGAYIDPGVKAAKLTYNHIRTLASYCVGLPFPATFGIFMFGTSNIEVRYNYVKNITDGGVQDKIGTGIGLYDSSDPFPTYLANNNVIMDNYLDGNDLDIQVITNGTGNAVKRNHCKKGSPTSACIG